MSPQAGWMSLCLTAALCFQPQGPRPRPTAKPRPIHRGIALKADPPGLPEQAPQNDLRLKSRVPRPAPVPGLPPGCSF